jgi:TfoX/Sxy family transcriptional regulator of competence genes
LATSADFINYVIEQLSLLPQISSKKMFGEYAIYYKEKVVALVCDNQFFLKQTVAGKNLLEHVLESPPYNGGKPCYVIENFDDKEMLRDLIIATYNELPAPKPKKRKDTK